MYYNIICKYKDDGSTEEVASELSYGEMCQYLLDCFESEDNPRFDLKVIEGTLASPNFYGGSFMSYKDMKPINGRIVLNKWIRVYTTFVADESNWSIHLGFAYLKGKYLIRNFKN